MPGFTQSSASCAASMEEAGDSRRHHSASVASRPHSPCLGFRNSRDSACHRELKALRCKIDARPRDANYNEVANIAASMDGARVLWTTGRRLGLNPLDRVKYALSWYVSRGYAWLAPARPPHFS